MPILLAVASVLLTGLTYWLRYGDGWAHLDHALHDWRRSRRLRASDIQTRLAPLKSLRDPADAAGVLMMLVARKRGLPTPEQESEILSRMRSVTETSEEDLATRMAVIRHAADQAPETWAVIKTLAPLLKDRLTRSETAELVDMLQTVGSVHGGPTEAQGELIEQLRRALVEDR
jgi:hypothetical protein